VTATRPEVGVIGLGIMGSAMAGHLLAHGPVWGTDISAERRHAFAEAGGASLESAVEVARAAEVVITSLPTAQAVQDVAASLAAAGRPGLIVIETSTLSLADKENARQVIERGGAVLLDCPLSGTGAQALEREVVVLGSGDEDAFAAVRGILEEVARTVRHLGPFGHGSKMKLVANLLVSVHNAAAAEAFALGVRAGLDPYELYDIVRLGAGGSVVFDRRGPLMAERRYRPATARVSMFVKDVGLIQELARSVDLKTPVLDATLPLYEQAMDEGYADADGAALREVLENMTSPDIHDRDGTQS
jgi:3-hydroxyisobutyrate dehydrogenase-like beta-hydroxyacid dehydrogenase